MDERGWWIDYKKTRTFFFSFVDGDGMGRGVIDWKKAKKQASFLLPMCGEWGGPKNSYAGRVNKLKAWRKLKSEDLSFFLGGIYMNLYYYLLPVIFTYNVIIIVVHNNMSVYHQQITSLL